MITWMLYAAAVGAVIAAGGLAMERLAAAYGFPRRLVWLAALTLAALIPAAGAFRATQVASSPDLAMTRSAEPTGTVSGVAWDIVPSMPLPNGPGAARAAVLGWGAASLLSLAAVAAVLLLVARSRRRWPRDRVSEADVYVSRRFGPALVGVTNPEVVVPSWVLRLERKAAAMIIRHEMEHARARDHLVLLYAALTVAALPWSPAIWWMARRLRAAVEMDCDLRILASGVAPAEYGEVLLDAGSRQSGRWGLSPAMSQPKSLLERRLKTMNENTKKLGMTQALLLGMLAVGALVAACDAPVPTQVQDALIEAMDEEGVARTEAEAEKRARELLHARAYGMDDTPLIYVDGVRVDRLSDMEGSSSLIPTLDPDAIDRIEILKGPAAKELYGEEAANGVIQIFLKTEGADAEGVGDATSIRINGDLRISASKIKLGPSTKEKN